MPEHPRFDLARATKLFPLAEVREQALERERQRGPRINPFTKEPIPGPAPLRPGGEIITSPYDIAIVEQVRDDVFAGARPGDGLPVDVFVFGLGPPSHSHLTAIGGLPFRSRRKPWPTNRNGSPCVFIGQISFVDSRDIVRDLPGDVLLIFGTRSPCDQGTASTCSNNEATPIASRLIRGLPTLMFGDMGSLYLHRDPQGRVSGMTQGY